MKKATILIMGLANIGETLNVIFRYSKKIYKINLIVALFLYLYLGFKVLLQTSLLNYLHLTVVQIFVFFYFSVSLLFIEMILVEFNLKKKINFSSSNFVRKTNVILLLTKRKYITPTSNETFKNKIESLAEQNNHKIQQIDRKFNEELKAIACNLVKKEIFEKKLENLEIHFNEKVDTEIRSITYEIKKIKDKIYKPKIIKHNNTKGIKNLFKEYKDDLFENLNVKNFIGYLFIDSRKYLVQKNELREIEERNIISILILLAKNNKIVGNKRLIHRLLNEYTNLKLSRTTINSYFSNGYTSLTNENNIENIKKEITNL